MSHNVPLSGLPGGDTPPSGGEPSRNRLTFAVVVVAVVIAVLVLIVLVRRARRAWNPDRRAEVIMFATTDDPYAGPTYRVEFFDGTYRQLRDRALSICLPRLHGEEADAALDQMARHLAQEVELLDSQRCFRPRVVVFDAAGNRVRAWTVTA